MATSSGKQDSPTDTLPHVVAPELRYRLFAYFGDVWFCDPDVYPVGHPTNMEQVRRRFAEIGKDVQTFNAITHHLGLEAQTEFSDPQKLLIYQEYKKLRGAVQLEPLDDKYRFTLSYRAKSGQGVRVLGVIGVRVGISILNEEPVPLTCPVCLSQGTRISTPEGDVLVEDVKEGMLVWTIDSEHRRVAMPVIRTSAVPVPVTHSMIRLVMKDGRELMVSVGHPMSDCRTVDQLRAQDAYDGVTVTRTDLVPYVFHKTYDLLPAGDTGFYWANGILVGSTLAASKCNAIGTSR